MTENLKVSVERSASGPWVVYITDCDSENEVYYGFDVDEAKEMAIKLNMAIEQAEKLNKEDH